MTDAGLRLLLVDDHDAGRLTLSVLLEDEGYAVDTAASCAEALERIGQGTYDAVLLDRNLGDGDGADLLPQIRQQQPAAKVVIVSGSRPQDDTVATADASIEKGMAFPDFVVRLRSVLGS